jgi:hypothetical protein
MREDYVARVARFAVAWATPGPTTAVMRQATVLELAPNEETGRLLVHSEPRG